MLQPTTDTDVCNLALDMLKQAPIVNLESPTTFVEARMARNYPQARRAVFRMHPWNFASWRVGLTASSDFTPAVGYTRAFRKPLDFVRFLYRMDSSGQPMRTEYDLEGDYILMDAEADETLYIRYIRDVTDVGKWDPLFLDMVAVMLAIRVGPNFSGSEARVNSLKETLIALKGDARAIDGQERPPRRREVSQFIQARRGRLGSAGRDQRYTYFS